MQDWIAYWKQVYADLCWYIIDQKLKEIWSYCSRYATVNYFLSLLTSPNDFSAANGWDTYCNTWSSAEFLIAYGLVLIKSVQSETSMWKPMLHYKVFVRHLSYNSADMSYNTASTQCSYFLELQVLLNVTLNHFVLSAVYFLIFQNTSTLSFCWM